MTVFTGTSGDDSILGTSGGDDFHIEQGGEDSASGGAGIDVFYLGAGFDAGDRIDGGDDGDFMVLEGDYSAGVVLGATTLTGVETVQLRAGFSYSFSGFTDANIAGGKLFIDGHTLGAGEDLIIDASGVATGEMSVRGGAGFDSFTGGDGDDVLNAVDGSAAVLHGGKGKDVITGTVSGADILGGGQGNDNLRFGAGALQVSGGDGDDQINGYEDSASQALVDGGAGDDVIFVRSAIAGESILGGDGDDQITVYGGLDPATVIDGGEGTDLLDLSGPSGSVLLSHNQFTGFEQVRFGGAVMVHLADDWVAAGETFHILRDSKSSGMYVDGSRERDGFLVSTGSQGNDFLKAGTLGADFAGGQGDDTLTGGRSADTLDGGYGSDRLVGGGGDDQLFGGAANRFHNGDETMLGGAGDDVITSNSGVGHIKGGSGNDSISVDSYGARATIDGGTGDDVISVTGTFSGDSLLDGGKGNDQLTSEETSTLMGGDGDDVLTGGYQSRLDGGAGHDIFHGSNNVTFVFDRAIDSSVDNPDEITDVNTTITIDLHGIDADKTTDGDQAFHWVDAFTGQAGELVADYDSFRKVTLISGDIDGDGQADFAIQADHMINGVHFVL